MRHVATGIGSMPGTDNLDSMHTVLGEVGDLPFLVELPDRGPAASMIARALALMAELAFELGPTGWRLSGATGLDKRRARSLLEHDLDVAAELFVGSGSVKVQVSGPCTLAASIELPRGGKALADPGARKDLAQALAAGAGDHMAAVRRRLPKSQIVVQIDEPALPAALAGSVPTASGLHRHRALSSAEAAGFLDEVFQGCGDEVSRTVVHCCAADVPFDVLRQTSVGAVSLDATRLSTAAYDDAAAWVDAGRDLWMGVVPALEPAEPMTDAVVTASLLEVWSHLGYTDPERLPTTTVTPTCGLAGASTLWARTALSRCAQAAENLSEEHGRMNA